MKILNQTVLNQITFHNLQSYLVYQYFKLWVLIRQTFCESLVTIQHIVMNVCWLCMEIHIKTQYNQGPFHNLQSNLAYWLVKMCTLIRHTIYESFVEIQRFRYEWSSLIYCRKIHKKDYILFAHVIESLFPIKKTTTKADCQRQNMYW